MRALRDAVSGPTIERMTTALETITLTDGTTRATLAPTRGGMLTRFSVGDRELLYLDESTLLDPTKNVRGGNPVLFPSPGPLADDRFTWGGRSGVMKQHGLARLHPWLVLDVSAKSATLALVSDGTTKAAFPWAFAVTFRYVVSPGRVRIEQRFENRDTEPMPFAAGFHPYFAVRDAEKEKVRIPTRATRAWDNVQKREVAVDGPVRIGHEEVDLHLLDHGATRAVLEGASIGTIEVSASEDYAKWIVWSVPGKDFVCLEPWTALANALGSGEGIRVVEPGATATAWVEIAGGDLGPA